MQIFNKSKRSFYISTSKLEPEQSIVITSEEGKKLLELYPDDLIAMAEEVKTEPTVKKTKKAE